MASGTVPWASSVQLPCDGGTCLLGKDSNDPLIDRLGCVILFCYRS